MLDIKFIRENLAKVKKAVDDKGVKVDLTKLLKLDEERRKLIVDIDELRQKRNKLTKEDQKQGKQLKNQLQKIEPKLTQIEQEFQGLMYSVPNLPAEDVKVGKDESQNEVIKKVEGTRPKIPVARIKDHLFLGGKLDLIDTETAAEVSGSRFFYLKNQAVILELALVRWVMDFLQKEGFTPIIPPVLIKKSVARGSGYFEATSDDAYHTTQDNLVLAGTAEQSILPYFQNKILEEDDLPRRFAGFSTCFRREAGSYGKDVKGILRSHQFDKVEMFSFCHPAHSQKEHQSLLLLEEKIMQALGLPYQVVRMCTGDLGLPAADKYDIEAWMPGQNRYRETHSTSNCTDFQARRLNIRYRNKNSQNNFVHTVNGTAIAIGRMLIAILENYQQPDGSIKIPEVLHKYVGFEEIKNAS